MTHDSWAYVNTDSKPKITTVDKNSTANIVDEYIFGATTVLIVAHNRFKINMTETIIEVPTRIQFVVFGFV